MQKLSLGSRLCEFCSTPFELKLQRDVERRKFCSPTCRQSGRWARGELDAQRETLKTLRLGKTGHNPPKEERICTHCGNAYQPNGNNQQWCQTCVPDRQARSRMQRYGISNPRYLEMLEHQNFVCAICKRREPEFVDHDHKTGAVRGLLCPPCNTSLGAFYDDAEVLERAVHYLKAGGHHSVEE